MAVAGVLENTVCSKCGNRVLEQDPEGDMHCWACGTTFIQDHGTVVVSVSLAQPSKVAVEPLRAIISSPEKVAVKVGQSAIHRKIDLIALHRETVTYHSTRPTQQSTNPVQRGRVQGVRIGHYGKTACKVEAVASLYNGGYGIRSIMQELCLAKNTVRKIIQENGQLIDYTVAKELRKNRVKQQKQSIILALKGLAGSAKSSNHSYEWMFEGAGTILATYIKKDPIGTVKSLVGDKAFSVDDLLKKTYETVLGQRLRLDDGFTEVEDGVFKLVNS